MRARVAAAVLVLFASAGRGQDAFEVAASVSDTGVAPRIRLAFTVPPDHSIYADEISVRATNDVTLTRVESPEPETKLDKFTGEQKPVFAHSFTQVFAVAPADAAVVQLVVRFQGCDQENCYMQKKAFTLALRGDAPPAPAAGTAAAAPGPAAAEASWHKALEGFRVGGKAGGYLKRPDFLAFLDRATGAAGEEKDLFQQWGLLGGILVILLGGLLLNLTPCVLPLVPINLAIIGAGARASSRGQGFLLGGLYGAAIALVYGILGLLVVLAGAKFGALNASPWFNAVIALVFVGMALAMFDVIRVDFTRFQSGGGAGGSRGRYAAAFVAGAISALLAGACVAPIVISVLLLATNLYAAGQPAAVLLPFLLGVGMGLPWPFAGAGLSFLPKPGAWMSKVKVAFGVVVLGFAAYYGWLAYGLFGARGVGAGGAGGDSAPASVRAFEAALTQARADGRPVFVDFWATWCKNCHAMESTTFKDPEVARRLQAFHVVKFQAEDITEPPAKDILDHFGGIGLPTYVVLMPGPGA